MCHGFTPRDWSSEMREEFEEELAKAQAADESDEPSFASEEPAEDVEIITDGGEES